MTAPDCLQCGSKNVIQNPRYFIIPGYIIVSNEYYLCDMHKHLNFYFDDIYNQDGSRKEIKKW